MTALTSQDYKASRRVSPDVRRLKDFAYGIACGLLLAGVAYAISGFRAHPSAAQVQAPPGAQHAPLDAESATPPATTYTFPARMTDGTLAVPLPDKDPGRDRPRRGPVR